MSKPFVAGTESGIEQFALHIYGLSETNSTRNNQMTTASRSDITLPRTKPTAILFTGIKLTVTAILAFVFGICIFRKIRKDRRQYRRVKIYNV